jgi:hypothetical protein
VAVSKDGPRYRLVIQVLVSGLGVSVIDVAFPEMQRNLIQRALLPFFCLRQPENFTLGIQHGTLSTDRFESANFDELFHELHSGGVKPNQPLNLSRVRASMFQFAVCKLAASLSHVERVPHCSTRKSQSFDRFSHCLSHSISRL